MRVHRKVLGRCPRRTRTAARSSVLISLCVALVACGETPEAVAPPPPDVLVADVVQKDVPVYGTWIGTTDGNINAQIRARVEGYLQSREYTEGSVVHADDLMFVIDPRPYKAAFDQAKGTLGRAEAALTKAQQDVERYTPLAKEGAVSQQELDNAIQAARAGRARVDSARANLEQAKLDLAWTMVKSPIEGVAGLANAQVGDLIEPNTLLTTVSQLDPLRVYFPISEQEYMKFASRIAKVAEGGKPGEDARSLELILADGSVFPHGGRAALADRQIDPKTGTITILSYFPNPENLLRPGQFVKVRAVTDMNKGALLVPQRAVSEQQGQSQVAVVGPDNKVELRNVEVGDRSGALWVIDEGLKPGERVVAEGLQKLQSGMTVNPKPFVEPTPAPTV